jgi:hypothetical protein
MLTKRQIENNITWLCKNATSPVKYLTYKNLLAEESSIVLSKLWEKVQNDESVNEIFKVQEEDGSWFSGGSWALKPSYIQKGRYNGYDPESPKYVTAIWILPLLGDMGFNKKDYRIAKACEYILNNKQIESRFKQYNDPEYKFVKNEDICGRGSQSLMALSKVGYSNDERVERVYRLLVNLQKKDGGWVSSHCVEEQGWTRSCPFATYHASLAIYSKKDKKYQKSLEKALEYLLSNLSLKNQDEISRFFYHGHSIVHELMMFSKLKIGLDTKEVKTIIEWLLSMYYESEGVFHYNGKPIYKYQRKKDGMDSRVAKYRLYHLIEDDWLTYYCTLIAKSLKI